MTDNLKGRMGLKLVAAATVAIATLAVSTTASAEPGVDWMKALVELDHFARKSPESGVAPSLNRGRPAVSEDPSPQNMGSAWFGVAPTVTLVARDWASSTRLAGDRLAFVDEVRLAASTRMVVGRLRLSTARFTPFLQAGLGQWRIDRNYMPLLPHTIDVASQVGTGFELRVSRRLQIATEVTATSLLRESDSQAVPQPILWSALVASRLEF